MFDAMDTGGTGMVGTPEVCAALAKAGTEVGHGVRGTVCVCVSLCVCVLDELVVVVQDLGSGQALEVGRVEARGEGSRAQEGAGYEREVGEI